MLSSESQRALFELAREQSGYFTAKQAASLGYTANKRTYHVGVGNWVRESRGIFRLAMYPAPERSDLVQWWLWSRGRDDSPIGVFSHATALALHELTDANPAKIDMTVPPSYRKGAPIPPVLRLHRGVVPSGERETIECVPVTSALRTIFDIWDEGTVPVPVLGRALAEALRSGQITRRQVSSARKASARAAILDELERLVSCPIGS